MQENFDAFFTQTIVGAPQSLPLGARLGRKAMYQAGVEWSATKGSRLTQHWQDWWTLHDPAQSFSAVRKRPSRLKIFLARHALTIAMLGLAALVAGLALATYALI